MDTVSYTAPGGGRKTETGSPGAREEVIENSARGCFQHVLAGIVMHYLDMRTIRSILDQDGRSSGQSRESNPAPLASDCSDLENMFSGVHQSENEGEPGIG